jgi:hypothetical protein
MYGNLQSTFVVDSVRLWLAQWSRGYQLARPSDQGKIG